MFIIDRFEGDFAVVEVENKGTVNMPRILLPEAAKEGDVIKIVLNDDTKKEREDKIKNLMNEVWE